MEKRGKERETLDVGRSWDRNLLLEPSGGHCWLTAGLRILTGPFPLSVSIKYLPSEYHTVCHLTHHGFSGPWHPAPSPQLLDRHVCPAQDEISSEIFLHPQAEVPAAHTRVSTSIWHCNDLFKCLPFTPLPLHCEILRAFFKGRNWVPLMSASLGLAQGWTSSVQCTRFLEESIKNYSWNVIQVIITESYCHAFLASNKEMAVGVHLVKRTLTSLSSLTWTLKQSRKAYSNSCYRNKW